MEESKELQKLYTFMQAFVYLTIVLEIVLFVQFPFSNSIMPILSKFARIPIYDNIFYSKLFTLLMIMITCIGTRSKKDLNFDASKQIAFPLISGVLVFFGCAFFLIFKSEHGNNFMNWYNLSYIALSFVGAMLINVALDNISKIIKTNFMKDRFNIENESFEQSKELINTEYSVNIPMKFYYKRKYNKGWINIVNPFRGTFVIGTPGSGKSFSVINSFIRQHSAKGFSMVVYDFKFPDLARIAYHHFRENKRKGNISADFKFNVVNFSDVEYSKRVNPLRREYIETLADATETAEALYESLQKGEKGGGNSDFFKTSAVNLLAASIYFWSRYEEGKYSDLPHVLAFLNHKYDALFKVLFSEPELESLVSPFQSAYESGAVDQLEGQMASLKIQLSRLATKESFFVFSGDDINLKVSDKENPSYLIIANNPKNQSMNSALNALIINRITRLVNTKGNLPTSIIVDESPTLYFYQLHTLLSTARSNKVSVCLGLQEIPQLEEQYGKATAKTVTSVIGNTLSGSARASETLDWLQKMFGKIKQIKEGVSITREKTTISVNEQMDYIIPASKIAGLQAGSLVGQIALDFGQEENFPTTLYHCKTDLDLNKIKKEEEMYRDLPKVYNFGTTEERERKLQSNYIRIKQEVKEVIESYI